MRIITVTDREFGENCYVISDGRYLYIIDPGLDYDGIITAMKNINLPLKYVLLTHGHYDHAFSAGNFDKTLVYAHQTEQRLLEDASLNLSAFTGKPFVMDQINYYSGEKYMLDDIKIYHTPGHTAGCVIIKIGDNLFSGDTLFYDTVGRTDLPGGDPDMLRKSLDVFDNFDKNITVYPGHGNSFILAGAFKINYFLRKIK